jgi:hypothetical protein
LLIEHLLIKRKSAIVKCVEVLNLIAKNTSMVRDETYILVDILRLVRKSTMSPEAIAAQSDLEGIQKLLDEAWYSLSVKMLEDPSLVDYVAEQLAQDIPGVDTEAVRKHLM